MPEEFKQCRCCGIPIPASTPRARFRVCILCDHCDGCHGDALQERMSSLVESGAMTMWHAISRMALENAHLCGDLRWSMDPALPGSSFATASAWLAEQPRPWMIAACRRYARNELPDPNEVIRQAIVPHVPCVLTDDTKMRITQEIGEALSFITPNLISIEVTIAQDPTEPGNLLVHVDPTIAEDPALEFAGAAAIPADIASRPRGMA